MINWRIKIYKRSLIHKVMKTQVIENLIKLMILREI